MTIRLTGGGLHGLTLVAKAPNKFRSFNHAARSGRRGKDAESPPAEASIRQDHVIRPSAALFRRSMFDLLASRAHPSLYGARFVDLCAGSGAVGIEALSRGAASCCFVELPLNRLVLEYNLNRAADMAHRTQAHDIRAAIGQSSCLWQSALTFRGHAAIRPANLGGARGGKHGGNSEGSMRGLGGQNAQGGPFSHIFADPPYRRVNLTANPEETDEAAIVPKHWGNHAHKPTANVVSSSPSNLAQRLLDRLANLALNHADFLTDDGLILIQRAPRQTLRTPEGLRVTDERRQGNAILMIYERA